MGIKCTKSTVTSAGTIDWEAALGEVLDLGLTSRGSREQNFEIITRRFGLISGMVETLEAIGSGQGISRERVRQLESKALSRIRRGVDGRLLIPLVAYRELVSAIQRKVDEHGGAVRKDDVVALLGPASGEKRFRPEMSVAFILWISPLYVESVKSAADQWVVYESESVADGFQQVTEIVHEFLQNNGPVEEEYLLTHLANHGWASAAAGAAIRVDPGIKVTSEYVWLIDSPKWHYLVASLRQLGTPAHFSEVTKWVNLLLHRDCRMSERAVHAMLGNHEPEIFRRVGLGTFGLAEWGLPAVKDTVDLVCQILEGEIRWLTFQEIVLKARATGWRVRPESIRAALDLENGRANRRVRKEGSGEYLRFGLSWWNAPYA